MHVPRFLLDEGMNAGTWGAELKSVILFLVMIIVIIGAIIWWLRR
jgi:flagellar biogenesis protein FliO